MTDQPIPQLNADGSFTLPDGTTIVPTLQIVPPHAAPPDPPAKPAPPTITGQTLTATPSTVKVGETINVAATVQSSDGTSKHAPLHTHGYNDKIVTSPNQSAAAFTAVSPGTTTIYNDAAGFTASAEVTVLPAPPKAAINVTVDGATVTVHDQTTGATSESIDFGDGTVMDDTQQ